jgi:hypothetical protein
MAVVLAKPKWRLEWIWVGGWQDLIFVSCDNVLLFSVSQRMNVIFL